MSEAAVKVAIRVRPALPGEAVIEDLRINEEGTNIALKNKIFPFDVVFGQDSTNKEIFQKLVSENIEVLFEGYNVTILGYGSTGSGKTFTMGTTASSLQTEDSLGLIPLGLKQIFDHAHSISQETDVVMKASFFEIYMDNVKDLLKKDANFIPGSKEARITNMSQVSVKNYNEAIQALKRGCQIRVTAGTSKNSQSSRSHAFFLISILINSKTTGLSKLAKFLVVDLAGSERAGTESSGKAFKQGVQINKGLTSLGRVFSSLSKRSQHIPYRDSILTKNLQESFGGNCVTIMVTCVSPAHSSVEETLSSLRYSAFAKKIENRISANRDPTNVLNENFIKMIEELEESQRIRLKLIRDHYILRINLLTNDIRREQKTAKMNKDKLMEIFTRIKSLEEAILNENFEMPLLEPYIHNIRYIKEDMKFFLRVSSDTEDEDEIDEFEEYFPTVLDYEKICDENDELKKKLEEAEKEIQQLRSTISSTSISGASGSSTSGADTSRKMRSKPKNSPDVDCSMMETFLNLSDEQSFTQESELQDPDFRATPMWKRKTKRKSPEDKEPLLSPKPSKSLSPSGCSCPGDCGSIRCSCRKRKKDCSGFCECNKAECLNTPSCS